MALIWKLEGMEVVGDAWVVLSKREARQLMTAFQSYFSDEDDQWSGWDTCVWGPSGSGHGAELTIEIDPEWV